MIEKPEPLAKSDDLPILSQFIPVLRAFGVAFGQVHQIKVVIDATIAISVLSFHARKQKSEARADLEELIASGTVIAYAPDWIETEISKHLPDLAAQWEVSVGRLTTAWDSFREHLRLCPESALTAANGKDEYARLRVIDAKDLPYALTREVVGAVAVLTKDRHFQEAGTPVTTFEIIVDLREYARCKAIELRIATGGTVLTMAAAGTVLGSGAALVSAARLIARAPAIVRIALAVVALALLIHPKSRTTITSGLRNFGYVLQDVWEEALAPTILRLMDEHASARRKADESWKRAKARLPERPRRLLLKDVAYGAVLGAGVPLTLDQVQAAVLAHGYEPRGRDFAPYLRTVLRGDKRLERDSDGRWGVRTSVRTIAL